MTTATDGHGGTRGGREARGSVALVGGLVSVVIPVYEQARYLGEAIESVQAQAYGDVEIIVVDDASTDDPASVIRSHEEITLLHQSHAGDAAARERGMRAARGEFLVFLDADDRLLPGALERGVRELRDHPEWAFVSGQYVIVDAEGRLRERPVRPVVQRDHYLEFLRGNYVGMFATVMFRTAVVRALPTIQYPVERARDYGLMLEIARTHPVGCHEQVIAEYRQHDTNVSRRSERMLRATLSLLERERAHARGNAVREQAIALGQEYYRRYYGGQVVNTLFELERQREWRKAASLVLTLARWHPEAFRAHVRTRAADLLRRIRGEPRPGSKRTET